MRPEGGAREPGAAAEIEHGAEALPMFRHRLAQLLRGRIGEVRECAVEARRVLVEQRAHIAVQRLRCRIGAAEPRKAQRRAMTIFRIGGRGALERGPRRPRSPSASRASPSANQADANPGTSSVACKYKSAAAARSPSAA